MVIAGTDFWPDMVSDMVFTVYFAKQGTSKTHFTIMTFPTNIRMPPCDASGIEFASMVFHPSHAMVEKLR